MKKRIKNNPYLFGSLFLLICAFTQKTYCTQGDCGIFGSGFLAFATGWLGVLVGGAYVCWLANPFLIVSWFFLKRRALVALILSSIALSIGVSFLSFDEIMINEAGHYGAIEGYALGYWLWLASQVLVVIGSLWYMFIKKTPKK